MEKLENNQLAYPQSTYNPDEPADDSIGWLPPFDPFRDDLPDPLHTDITLLASPSSTNTISPTTTAREEDDANEEDFIKAVPPDILDSLVAMAAIPPGPAPEPPPTPSTPRTTSSASPSLASSALFSPTTVCMALSASPPTRKRHFSTLDFHDQSQDPTPGPPPSRPTKRPCISYPGEDSFQLDTSIAPLKPSQLTAQQMGKPREPSRDYSACKCEGGLTSKPARHWRVCPYNPESGDKPFECDFCDIRFGRDDNKQRHVKEYHPEMI